MPTQVNDKLWNWASEIDEGTLLQAAKTSRLPVVAGHVALMPDAHVGIGATVGSVIPTENAVIPAAVGVDIGCGMIAVQTDLTASQLPDDLTRFIGDVERAIPAGVGQGHGRSLDLRDLDGDQQGPHRAHCQARGHSGDPDRVTRFGEPLLRDLPR